MSALGRLRRLAQRLRSLPGAVEQVQSTQHRVLHETTVREEEALHRLDGLRTAVDQLLGAHAEGARADQAVRDELTSQLRTLTDRVAFLEAQVEVQRQESTARHDQHRDDRRSDQLEEAATARRLAHAARVAQEIALAPARDAAAAALLADLGPVAARRPGLSVITATWNHGGWLVESTASARAALDSLPEELRGELLVLDDASSDETSTVLAGLATTDPTVRVLRSPTNLGLGRARNVLLAACPTTHAVVLDADNRLLPDGTAAVLDVAMSYRSTITFGQVIASDDEGARWDAFAYAPSAASLPGGLCFDSMAVVDVAAVEELGGYTVDPQLEGVVDDLELLMRALRRGNPVGYVPTVLGRYRLAAQRISALISDQHLLVDRVRRLYLYDDPDLDSLPIFGAHPATGVLWAAPATGLVVPDRADRAADGTPAEATGRPRLALVASGGVGNLGDDAITDAVLHRLRRLLPDAEVDLFTDRGRPATTGGPVPWRGTVLDAWRGLDPEVLGRAAAAAGLDPAKVMSDRSGTTVFRPDDYAAVVVAGGGFLATPFARDLLVPRVAVALACAAAEVPVVWSGQGVGPCTEDELELVAAAARSADAFGCRDPRSAELVGLVAPGAAVVVGDDAMAVAPSSADGRLALRPVGDGPIVVLHARDASYLGATDLDAAAAAADELAHRLGGSVVGLAVNDNAPAEHELLVAMARSAPRQVRWTTVDATGRPDVARGVLRRAEAVVAHSYHVALWALCDDVPAVLVTGSDYYREKAAGLAGLAGFPATVGVEPGASADEVVARLDEVRSWLGHHRLGDAADDVERWWADVAAPALKF